jgi:hypothetical protein
MMPSAVPPGRQREQELIERLDDIQAEIEELRSALPSVNDPVLRTHVQALAEAAARVVTAHRGRPGPDIADDLAGLMSAAHTLRVPAQDPELGRTQTLQTLRTAKGLIVAALGDALDVARALGLQPRQLLLPHEFPMEVPRAGNEGPLRGIEKRLDELVTKLDALDNVKPTNFPQQTGLVNFYVGAMRVEVDLARLHLTVGEQAIDLGALARAVEVIMELTGDFIATIRAWVSRVSDEVTQVAEEVRTRVRRLAAGTSAAAKWIGRKARLSRAASVEPGEPSLLDGRAGEMELSFDPSDPECVTQVPVALFGQGGKVKRFSFATSIRVRVQANSGVTLKNVMAYITKLEKLLADGEWQESNSPDIQLTWTDTDNFLTDIPGSSVKYANLLHIDHADNKIAVWQTPMPPPLVDFVKDVTKYRFTVSVIAREVRYTGIEIDWKGQWDKMQVSSAPRESPRSRHAREDIIRPQRELREATRDIARTPTTLDIHFDETDQRCRTETKFNGVLDAVFFRLVITNNSGLLQRACRGFGREVRRGDGSLAMINRQNVQLTWATFSDPLPTMIDLTNGEEQNLDVFFIAADGTIGFATPNFVRPGSWPTDFFSLHEPYTFTVAVASNDSAARIVRLILDWGGDWKNAHVRGEIGLGG